MKQQKGFWKTIVTIVIVVASTSLLASCDEDEALPQKSTDASFEEIDGMVIAEIETLPATDFIEVRGVPRSGEPCAHGSSDSTLSEPYK